MKKAIVIDSQYGSVSLQELQALQQQLAEAGVQLQITHCKDAQSIIEKAQGFEILLCTGNPPVNEAVLTALSQVEAVIRFGIGVNSIDLDAASRLGIVVMNMPGFCINELAVHATAMILALERNLLMYDRKIRAGGWPKATGHLPRAPRNMTLGLYGFGGSARELYQIFRFGFGSRVIACDPYVPEAAKSAYEVEFVDFDQLLAQADIVSVHAPLTPQTRHIFNAEAFRKMKEDAMIINIARGELIDQQALEQALEEGQIRYAGLDVFEQEPLGESGLKQRDDVALSCHSAFYGVESKAQQLRTVYEIVKQAVLEGTIPERNIANRAVMTNMKFTAQ